MKKIPKKRAGKSRPASSKRTRWPKSKLSRHIALIFDLRLDKKTTREIADVLRKERDLTCTHTTVSRFIKKILEGT